MTARDPNDWMWERASELLERTAWVQRRFFQVAGERGAWEPPVDVFESTEEWLVLVALPGVPSEHVEVTLSAGVLLVVARRSMAPSCERSEVRRIEIPQGRFQRRVPLESERVQVASTEMKDGLLCVRVRKLP